MHVVEANTFQDATTRILDLRRYPNAVAGFSHGWCRTGDQGNFSGNTLAIDKTTEAAHFIVRQLRGRKDHNVELAIVWQIGAVETLGRRLIQQSRIGW